MESETGPLNKHAVVLAQRISGIIVYLACIVIRQYYHASFFICRLWLRDLRDVKR